MGLIIALGWLGCVIASAVFVVRRIVRHVRQVPARPQAAPDLRILRHRFVRVVFGVALVTGFVQFVTKACAYDEGYSRGLFVIWEHAGLALVAAIIVAPLVARWVSGDAWATSSIVLPTAGIALVLPLTLHLGVFLMFGEKTMDEWCVAGLLGAGVAHVTFAILFAARTVSLVRSGQTALSVGELFAITTMAGGVPYFIFGMGVTALTGVFILPVISLAESLALREHAATAAGLPRAIVTPCRA